MERKIYQNRQNMLSRREFLKISSILLASACVPQTKNSDEILKKYEANQNLADLLSQLYGIEIKSPNPLRRNHGLPTSPEKLTNDISNENINLTLMDIKYGENSYYLVAGKTGLFGKGGPGVNVLSYETEEDGWDATKVMPWWFRDYLEKIDNHPVSIFDVRKNNPESERVFFAIKHAPLDFSVRCGLTGVCSNEKMEGVIEKQLHSLDLFTTDPDALTVSK